MTRMPSLPWGAVLTGLVALLVLLIAAAPAHADVTVQQHSTMTLAGINIDITESERTSSDKQRSDSTVQCHGFLALFCRNVQSAEIRRLDKQLEWELQPKKQLCIERDFPTADQRAQAQQTFEAAMAQMKSCPMPQQSAQAAAPDTSHCQMGPAKLDVQQSGEHRTLIGHDAHRSTLTLSQTCTDPQTGHVCQFDYGFELWLTSDVLPGLAERRDFAVKYATAQGLDPNDPQLRGMMQQFMAPYADTLKQLQTQGAGLQGYPLRTTFFMDFGGPQCADAQQQQQQQQQQAQQQSSHHRGGLFGGIASNAVTGGVSGLFHHNVNIPTSTVGGQVASNAASQTADAAASAAGNATANGVADASAPAQDTTATSTAGPSTPPGMVRTVSFITEVTSIDTSSIDASQFDLPSGYRIQPPPPPQKNNGPVCPANDH